MGKEHLHKKYLSGSGLGKIILLFILFCLGILVLGAHMLQEMRVNKNRLWLSLPPFIFCMLDQGLTLWYQPAEYWRGHYEEAFEGDPIMFRLLSQHPLIFETVIVMWVIVFTTLIISLPKRLAMILSIAITIGHTLGAVSWIRYMAFYNYPIYIILIFVVALMIVLAWEEGYSSNE